MQVSGVRSYSHILCAPARPITSRVMLLRPLTTSNWTEPPAAAATSASQTSRSWRALSTKMSVTPRIWAGPKAGFYIKPSVSTCQQRIGCGRRIAVPISVHARAPRRDIGKFQQAATYQNSPLRSRGQHKFEYSCRMACLFPVLFAWMKIAVSETAYQVYP